MITCSVNGKKYVGQTTVGVSARWRYHLRSKKKPCGIRGAISKYGRSCFSIQVVDQAENQKDLDEKEQFWVTHFGSMAPNGYNLTMGGSNGGGGKRSAETKERMRQARKGKKHTAEARKKIGEASRGRKFSCESKMKLSLMRKGKPRSEETKLKISRSLKGHPVTESTKEKVRIGNTGKKRSAEAIEKSRLGHIGLKRTEETKERMKQAQRARREKEQK